MNEPRRRGPIARLFIGLWNAINFSRRLVFNLLFLLVLALLLAAMLGGGKLAPLAERTTLVLAPQGRLVEQFSCDPLSRAFARATDGEDCRERRGDYHVTDSSRKVVIASSVCRGCSSGRKCPQSATTSRTSVARSRHVAATSYSRCMAPVRPHMTSSGQVTRASMSARSRSRSMAAAAR